VLFAKIRQAFGCGRADTHGSSLTQSDASAVWRLAKPYSGLRVQMIDLGVVNVAVCIG
jgi:hypothetical protein